MSSIASQQGVVDGIVVEPQTVYVPGHVKWAEPVGMRPANLRLAGDRVGEYHLANGQVVWVTWVPTAGRTQTHTDIWLWDAHDYAGKVSGVMRARAAQSTENELCKLEN